MKNQSRFGPKATAVLFGMLLALVAFTDTAVAGDLSIEALKQRFASPPANAGTTTLWWLNGKLTKEQIREQMLNLRDRDGFGGVAPLTLFRMKPATEPAYLTDEYFEMYGCILDTAKELGMTVVFYDDCDFPSGHGGQTDGGAVSRRSDEISRPRDGNRRRPARGGVAGGRPANS